MNYLTTIEMSKKWGITSRRIAILCEQGRIDGVVKKGKTWLDIEAVCNTKTKVYYRYEISVLDYL